MLLLPTRLIQQPQGPVGVDNSHPFAGNFWFPLGNHFYNAYNQSLLIRGAGTAQISPSLVGNALLGDQATYFTIPTVTLTPPYTIMCIASGPTGSVQYAMPYGDVTDTASFLWLNDGAGNQGRFRVNGNDNNFPNSNIDIPATYIVTVSATSINVYKNGINVLRDSFTSSPTFNLRSIGAGYSSTNFYLNGGIISCLATLTRSLSEQEVKQWTSNPWQTLKINRRKVSLGITTTNINVSVGVLSGTYGFGSVVGVDRILVPPPLSATYSLPSVTVSTGSPDVTISVGFLSASYLNSSPSIIGSSNIFVGVLSGTYSLGSNIDFDETVSVIELSATYSLPSVTVSFGTNITVSVGVLSGTYSLGASASSDDVTFSNPLSANYSLQSPTINTGVTVSVGVLSSSYSLNSVQVNTGVTTLPNVLSGSYSLSTDTINFGTTVSTGLLSASYSIPSVIVNTGGSVTVQVGVISASYSEPSPQLNHDIVFSVGVLSGSYSLNSVQVNTGNTVSVGVLSASYSEPTVQVNTGVTTSSNVLSATYSLQNTQVNTGNTVSVGVLSASYSLQSPTVQIAGGVTVQVGVLSATFSESAPTIIGSAVISVPSLSSNYSLQIPQINTGTNVVVSVNPLTEIININNPTITTNSIVSVGVLTCNYSLQNPTFGSGNVIKLRRIEGY